MFSSKIADPPFVLPCHTHPSSLPWAGPAEPASLALGEGRNQIIHGDAHQFAKAGEEVREWWGRPRREGGQAGCLGEGPRGCSRCPAHHALCPTPGNKEYCFSDTLFPPWLPPIPSPSLLWALGLVKSRFPFWFYSSEGLETGKPTHSLDLSSLPKQTARQIRI